MFGFYIHIFILMIALTGLVWSYKWVNNLVYYTLDGNIKSTKIKVPESLPVKDTQVAYLDKMLDITNKKLTYPGAVMIRFPENDSLALTISKEVTTASISNVVDFLYFQKGTGDLVKERLYKNESKGMKARRLFFPIHTGSIYGWPTKILALICAWTAASLPVTGLMIWLGRKKKKKKPSLKKHVNTRVQYQ